MSRLKWIVITIIMVGLGVLLVPVNAILVSQGTTITYAFLQNDDVFSLQWIHSVEKEAWVENFIVDDQIISLDSTKFKTFGAGVPTWSEHSTEVQDGWVYMQIDRVIGAELVLRSSLMNDYQLIYQKKRYPLEASNMAYIIEAKQAHLFFILWTTVKEMVG